MCEQTPIHYKHGDIVWVKLDLCWWPGQVIDFEALPSDLQDSFIKPGLKKPLVVVSFFQEKSYEYVMNLNIIYSYNCTRKDDFIRRAMDLIRAKNSLMDKFPSDIRIAEEMTGGDVDILKDPKYGPQKKKISYASMIFGSAKKKEPTSKPKGRPKNTERSSKGNIIHPRFTGECDNYEVRLLVQTSTPEPPARQNRYTCEMCSFETSRIDVIVLHNKSHSHGGVYSPISYSTPRPSISPRRPQKKFRIPVSKTNTIDEDLALLEKGISLTDNESSNEEEIEEPVKPKVKRKQRNTDKRKGKKSKVDQPAEQEDKKKDIRVHLLAEWDDSDEEGEESITNNNQSMESATTSITETPTKPRTPDESTKTDKSCFDFKEDEEQHILTPATSSGRKIPRVIPEKRKSIEPDSAPSTAATEDTFEADLSRFTEVLESTTAPITPELPSSLKCEQNFHYTKAIKFPDKCEESQVEESPKPETSPKLINIKKRFVKSFEDFEQSLKMERAKEKEENYRLEDDNKKEQEVGVENNNCEAEDELMTQSSDEVKEPEIKPSSVNEKIEEETVITSPSKENKPDNTVFFADDLKINSDNEAIGNLSTSSDMTGDIKAADSLKQKDVSIASEMTDNLEKENGSALEIADNLEKSEATIDAFEAALPPEIKEDTETMIIKSCSEPHLVQENMETKNIDSMAPCTIVKEINDMEVSTLSENPVIETDTELVVQTQPKSETSDAIETNVASNENSVSLDETTETVLNLKDITEISVGMDFDTETLFPPKANTTASSKHIPETVSEETPKPDAGAEVITESKKLAKEPELNTSTEIIEDPSSEKRTNTEVEIKVSPKETRSRRSQRDEIKDTKTRRSYEDEHLPIKKSKYSRKTFHEETKKTRTKRLSTSEDEMKTVKSKRGSVTSNIDEDQNKTRTERPSFSLDDEDGMKKLMSKLPSFSAKSSTTVSSFSEVITEDLKKTRWNRASHGIEEDVKKRTTRSSASTDCDENIVKTTRSSLSLEINEDVKKTRSSRSGFSTDFGEDLKKIKSTRSSISQDFLDEDLKKRGLKKTSSTGIYDTDKTKPSSSNIDERKTRSIRSTLSRDNEDTKKRTLRRSSASVEIDDGGKVESTKLAVSPDIKEDLKKTRSKTSMISAEIDQDLKKGMSKKSETDTGKKKLKEKLPLEIAEIDEGSKIKKPRKSFILPDVDNTNIIPISTLDVESKKKPPIEINIEDGNKIPKSNPPSSSEIKRAKSKWTTDLVDNDGESEKDNSSLEFEVEKKKKSQLPTDDGSKKTASDSTDFVEDKKKLKTRWSSVPTETEATKKKPTIDDTTKELQEVFPSEAAEDTKKLKSKWSALSTDDESRKKKSKFTELNQESKKIESLFSSFSADTAQDTKKIKSKWSDISVDEGKKKKSKRTEDDLKNVDATSDSILDDSTEEVKKIKSKWCTSVEEDGTKIKSKWAVVDESKVELKPAITPSVSGEQEECTKKKIKCLPGSSSKLQETKKKSRWGAVPSDNIEESKKISNLIISDVTEESAKESEWSTISSDNTEEFRKKSKWSTHSSYGSDNFKKKSKLSTISIDSTEEIKKKSKISSDAAEDTKIKSKWSISPDLEGGTKKKSKWSTVDDSKKVQKTKFPSRSYDHEVSPKKTKSRWSSASPDHEEEIKKTSKWSVEEDLMKITGMTKPDSAEETKSSPLKDSGSDFQKLGEHSGLCLKVSKLKSRLMDKLNESEIELQRPKAKTWIHQKTEERMLKRRMSAKSPRRLSLQSQEISIEKAVDKVEVTINEGQMEESLGINNEEKGEIVEKQIEQVSEVLDEAPIQSISEIKEFIEKEKVVPMEVKIPIEESKLESILRSPGLPQEHDENSALNTLATISELSSYDLCQSDINIEKNLTVVSESDLGDAQVEIAKIPIIEEGTVKATTVASFSVDFTEDLSVLENNSKSAILEDDQMLEKTISIPRDSDLLDKKADSPIVAEVVEDMLEYKEGQLISECVDLKDKEQSENVHVFEGEKGDQVDVLENAGTTPVTENISLLENKEEVAELHTIPENLTELENKSSVDEEIKAVENKENVAVLEENVILATSENVTVEDGKDVVQSLESHDVFENSIITSEDTAVIDNKEMSVNLDMFEDKKTSTTLEDVAAIDNKKTPQTLEDVDILETNKTLPVIEDDFGLDNRATCPDVEDKKESSIDLPIPENKEKVTKKIDILADVKIPELKYIPSGSFKSKKAVVPLKKFGDRLLPPKKFIEQIPNSVEMEMAKLTDTSMDTTIVEQPQESTTSSKLLEILTDPKISKPTTSQTSQLKIANPKFELDHPHPPKPKAKLLIRSSLPGSSRTGGKQMILSEKIIKTTKEVHSSPVSVQKTNDTEGIEAFIIHKKDTSDALKIVKKPLVKKPTILDHTIIKNAGEVVQPVQQKTDDNVFDIDSMPIVLTDQILTTDNIDAVPIMMQEKAAAKAVPGKMKLLNKTPVLKEGVNVRPPHLSKSLKPQKIFQQHSIAKQSAGIMSQSKGKVMIVPSEASTSTVSKYTVGKRLIKKSPTTIISGSTKLHNVQEPTGNKIMIVTNNQGQQSRVVLTPAQQKLIGYQGQTLKKVVKGGKSPNIISQTIINSKGQITTTNQAVITSTTSSLSQVKKPKIEPSKNKVLGQKLLLQSSLNQLKPGQPRTIIIKNPQGQTVKKIHGTDDALLEKQVQEQIEAINRATWSQGSVKTVPKKYYKKTLTESTKIALQQKAQLINSSGATSSKVAGTSGIPPLSPIIKKTETQTKAKPPSPKAPPSPVQPEGEKGAGEKRAPHQLVIQDALGNQTTITEGQILALPSETVDGQPQSYMLVTLDETGNLTPLNNEALMSLDPNLNLGGDLSNMVLQIDQGAVNAEASPETPPPEAKVEEVVTEQPEATPIAEPEKSTPPEPPLPQVDPNGMQAVACAINNGDSNQQLIITGDPASTQKFLESLTEGNSDLANLLANAEGNILIHADGQQILINTDSDNQMLLSMNSDGTTSMDGGEGSGNPIFSSQAPKNQDILAAALADTDVFQQEQSLVAAKVTQSQLSPPGGVLYPMNVNNVLETSSMNSPIMTPLEVPSTNSKKIVVEADILGHVPKNVDLPITITDPNISQTVAHQQAALMSNDLHSNLDLPLAIQDVAVTSAEMNSPSFAYSLPNLDDSVDIQKPFTNSISMPLLTEISDDVATTSAITASTTLPSEIIEVEHGKEILVETSVIPEKIHEETVIEEPIKIAEDVKKTDSQYLLATSGLSTISNQMCSSLSEPPPDMFDFTIDQSYDLKSQHLEISPPITESPVDDEFLDAEKTESESEQASFTPPSNSPSTNSTDSCEIPVQPEIVTDISSKSSETELRTFDDDEKCKFD